MEGLDSERKRKRKKEVQKAMLPTDSEEAYFRSASLNSNARPVFQCPFKIVGTRLSRAMPGFSLSAHSFIQPRICRGRAASFLAMSSTATTAAVPSWTDLVEQAAATPVGKALNNEVSLRKEGKGSAARENTLRKFGRDGEPVVTLYR
eukprot:scaffold6695_cov155-Amphora_coffeaeformis.AAC.6